jgi:hypothetical protein
MATSLTGSVPSRSLTPLDQKHAGDHDGGARPFDDPLRMNFLKLVSD